MEFVNLTPIAAAAYRALDAQDREHAVVVARAVYRLQPAWQIDGTAAPQHGPMRLVPQIVDDDAPPLVTEDRYHGETGRSSVRAESDLAPFKPRCDVLVSGCSHAPGGQPRTGWLATLRVSQRTRHAQADGDQAPVPDLPEDAHFARRLAWQEAMRQRQDQWLRAPDVHGEHQRDMLLDKTLQIHAPRHFSRGALGGWTLKGLGPAREVPLLYERAYGGSCVVRNPRHGADPQAAEFLLNEVCYLNPAGCGWFHKNWERALKAVGQNLPGSLPAPQIEPLQRPVLEPDFVAQDTGLDVSGMLRQAQSYRHQAAGFGPLGRAWTPRIQRAGRYDEAWLKERWPMLPRGFDMGYWNAAPVDQQIPFPRPDAYVELLNLVHPMLCPSGYAWLALPGHRVSVLFHTASGLMVGGPCVIDTLHIDTDAMELAMTWRASLSVEMKPRLAELRMELDLGAALFNAKAPGATVEGLRHG